MAFPSHRPEKPELLEYRPGERQAPEVQEAPQALLVHRDTAAGYRTLPDGAL